MNKCAQMHTTESQTASPCSLLVGRRRAGRWGRRSGTAAPPLCTPTLDNPLGGVEITATRPPQRDSAVRRRYSEKAASMASEQGRKWPSSPWRPGARATIDLRGRGDVVRKSGMNVTRKRGGTHLGHRNNDRGTPATR